MLHQKHNFQGDKIKNTRIGSSTFIDHPRNLFISDNIYIGHHNYIEASHIITIEEGVQITNFVSITTHSSHHSIRLYGKNYTSISNRLGNLEGSIHIGSYTFIGPYALIMPNTSIGKGSIICAYSYVKGEFPDDSIIAGNPAQIIGNTKDKDRKLLEQYPELQQYYYRNESDCSCP
ncbi:MAG: acyltransferase [Bacteroidetes bacterium]|nr:acyltransferase [Bacteroidota bacterium]